MPICKICGEEHPEYEMATEDTCIFCDLTLIHDISIENGQLV